MPKMIDTIDSIANGYAVLFCDVWGVIHNGIHPFEPAVDALRRARASGLAVVLITNSPRPKTGVIEQLAAIGVPEDCWDKIVSSGDVTRELIRDGARRVFHIGPDRDMMIYDGLDVEIAEEFEAQAVVCTGLFDDETETPEDYAEMLQRLRARNLPFICANPDLVVERGHKLILCAGAIAQLYEELGGTSYIAGKPHRPIYEKSLAEARAVRGEVTLDRIVAIGDGMPTDIRGAQAFGLDVVYISGGIHAQEYVTDGQTDVARLEAFLKRENATPQWWMPRLQ